VTVPGAGPGVSVPAIFQEGIVSDKTCERCGRAKHRGRCKAAEAVKRASSRVEKQEAPPAGLSLEVARGYGFRARAEDGVLIVEQDATDGTAAVVLSKTEAKVLFAQFAEWCES